MPEAVVETRTPDNTVQLPKQLRDQMAAADRQRQEMSAPTTPTPAPEAAPPATQPAATPAATAAPEEDADQRFRSLQGRLEAERRNNQALMERLANMEGLVATLQVQGKGPAPEPVTPKFEPLITEQERTDYGEEMLDVVARRARETYMPDFNQLQNKIEQLETRLASVGNVMEKSAEEKVWDALTEKIPDWEEVNNSEEFKSWLRNLDPYSGQQKIVLLQDAFRRHDANRVVAFFQGYLEASGLPQTPQGNGTSAPPLAGNGQASEKPSLMDYAAPGRARSAPQSELPPEKPVYSQAQIAKFYADMRTGKYKGREADAAAIESDIFRAQHEGRIQ